MIAGRLVGIVAIVNVTVTVKILVKFWPWVMLSIIDVISARLVIVTSCLVSFLSWIVNGDLDLFWCCSIFEIWLILVAILVEVMTNLFVLCVTLVFM